MSKKIKSGQDTEKKDPVKNVPQRSYRRSMPIYQSPPPAPPRKKDSK